MATHPLSIQGTPQGFKIDMGEVIAAKLKATKAVLADRERELLELKGPCSSKHCRLHYAHSGPCDIRTERTAVEA